MRSATTMVGNKSTEAQMLSATDISTTLPVRVITCCHNASAAQLQRVSDVLKQPALLQGVDAAAALQLWQQRATATQPQQHHNHQQHHHNHHHQQQQVVPHRQHPGSSSSSRSRWEPQRLLQCLQRDVVRCVHADRSYSPYCDMAKSLAGEC